MSIENDNCCNVPEMQLRSSRSLGVQAGIRIRYHKTKLPNEIQHLQCVTLSYSRLIWCSIRSCAASLRIALNVARAIVLIVGVHADSETVPAHAHGAAVTAATKCTPTPASSRCSAVDCRQRCSQPFQAGKCI